MTIPTLVFIVPYRNRKTQKFFFCKHMEYILENEDYEVYFSHQTDNRPFNRGAVKNIGFLAVKEKYPDHYKNITFVFHDIDTLPFDRILDYKTRTGEVKHFYGFEHSLGGIFSIKGEDFELTMGFPNLWGWGMEDSVIHDRCLSLGLLINRNEFYKIGSPEILHLFDGVQRIINPGEQHNLGKNIENINITALHEISYEIDTESTNPVDNIFITENKRLFYVNIKTFKTLNRINDNFYKYDLRHPISKISNPNEDNIIYKEEEISDWSNIPYYPTQKEKNILEQKFGKKTTDRIINYNQGKKSNVHIFSPEYARINKIKPRATTSASIGLGGIIYR